MYYYIYMEEILTEKIQLQAKKLLNSVGSYVDNHRELSIEDSGEICYDKVVVKAHGNTCELIIDRDENMILETAVFTLC